MPAARDALVRRFGAFGAVNKTGRFVAGGGWFLRRLADACGNWGAGPFARE